MAIWCMRIARWIPKATHTHTHIHREYVILTAFPLQQWLHEGFSMVRYTFFTCLFICSFDSRLYHWFMNEINIISQIRSKFKSVTDAWLFCKTVYRYGTLSCNLLFIRRYNLVGVYQHFGVPLLVHINFLPNISNHQVDFIVR